MKKTLLTTFVFLLCWCSMMAQNTEKKTYKLLLSGASFASPRNGWFELGCKHLEASPVNRAIGSESIATAANRLINGELYTLGELEDIDALVLMHVHDNNVAVDSLWKEDYLEYTTPFKYTDYTQAYDYVIKRYVTECYNLKFNEKSTYYNTPVGKPAIVVLCTHWHDSRVNFNSSIRKLAAHWGFPLVEFDKYIGFSKNTKHPVTKEQMSLLYTNGNKREEHGEVFGWHPQLGEDKYIQQRMASIFVDTMKKILPLK